MPLDLARIAPQVEKMTAHIDAGDAERQKRLAKALSVLCDNSLNLDDLKNKITAGKTSWMPAEPVESLYNKYTPGQPPKLQRCRHRRFANRYRPPSLRPLLPD